MRNTSKLSGMLGERHIMITRMFSIIGKVLDRKTRRGAAGLRVEAWDKDRLYDDQVGSAVTDPQGVFRITFSESSFREFFGDRRPDLYFKVFRGAELIIHRMVACWSQSINVLEPNSRWAWVKEETPS